MKSEIIREGLGALKSAGMVEDLGFYKFGEEVQPRLPFAVYYPGTLDTWPADNVAYFGEENMIIEIYTRRIDPDLLSKVGEMLTGLRLYYSRGAPTWLDSEGVFMTPFYC